MTGNRAEGSIFKALRQVKQEQFGIGSELAEMSDHVGDLTSTMMKHHAFVVDYVQHERHGDKVAKRLVAGLAAAFVLTGSLLAYDIWENRRNRQVMNTVVNGNVVFDMGEDVYAVHQTDPMSNATCRQFEVSKVILSHLNNRPYAIETKPAATFRIGCDDPS